MRAEKTAPSLCPTNGPLPLLSVHGNHRAKDRQQGSIHPQHLNSGAAPTSPLLGLVPYFLSQGRMFLKGRGQTASGGGQGSTVPEAASGDSCGGRCSASLQLAEAKRGAPCLTRGSAGRFWKRGFKVCSGFLLQLCINNKN